MLSCITHLGYLAVVKLICARKYLPLGKLAPVSARKGLCGDDKGSLLGKGGSAGGNQGIFYSSWTVLCHYNAKDVLYSNWKLMTLKWPLHDNRISF